MDYRSILLLFVCIANLVLAYFIYSKSSKNNATKTYFFFVLFDALWAMALLLYDLSPNPIVSLWAMRLAYFFAAHVGTSLLIFVINYFREPIKRVNLIFLIIAAISVSFITLSQKTLVLDISNIDWGKNIELGSAIWRIVFSVYFIGTFFGGLLILARHYVKSSGILKSQIKYMLFGILIPGVLGSVFNLVLPFTITFQYFWVGPIFTLIMIGSIAYAIVAHRLFDIRVIIKRTVIFAGLSAFVLGTYALIILATATILGGGGEAILASRQMIPNLVAALGIALGFDPLRKWLTVRTDKWLFKGEYTPQAVLQELSETLANVVDLGEAVEEMMQIVTKAMRLNKSAAFLIQPSDTHGDYELKQLVTVGYQRKEGMQQIAPKDSLLQYFLHTNIAETKYQPVVAEELSRQLEEGSLKGERAQLTNDFLARLTGLEAAVALPLFIRRQQPVPTPPGSPPRFRDIEIFIGILTLSEKKSGDAFTDQDLNLLSIVASQTAGAVEKSRLFEEDQLKSEFVSIASHELLTPTAAMEGYLSMILEEGMGKVDKQARGYLETVYRESKRLASLVKDLLNVSRIERGKIVVHPAPLDLAELIKQVLESLKFRAEERRIKLTLTMKDKLPKVMADSEKLTEVMVNLIGNSIKYTHEGGQAAITTETRNGQVLVHIKDNGIGMKPEDVQHLFTKFFRASNSDQTNQGGTGLGLYITKNIIELMGGTIGVESELNKGSTFTFSLPVAK